MKSLLILACLLTGYQFTLADAVAQQRRPGGGGEGGAPIPRPMQRPDRPPPGDGIEFPLQFRTIDGSGNHLRNPDWGAADIEFLRLTTVGYADGASEPSGPNRPSAREVSNACAAQTESVPNDARISDYLWQWGQFLDHDIDETPAADPAESFPIAVPAGDPWFDPGNTGTQVIGLNRSGYDVTDGVRQQINLITAYIDASNVYGSDEERAEALRARDGTGRLKTSAGDLLPYNDDGFHNAEIPDGSRYFLAGDVRANEQLALTAMHTLFVREHNYWAGVLASADAELSGDEIYEMARAMVGAEMQAITYNEFLPVLLGEDALPPYRGFNSRVNPGISNVFATSAYRVGHTMLSSELVRVDANGDEAAEGNISLADAFFAPEEIEANGIDSVLRGLSTQVCQKIDMFVIDDVRNFLFGPPGAGGFDLASLNIQRGRDHGLPGFNRVRRDFGLQPARNFRDINPDPKVAETLRSVYGSVGQVDSWVGLLAEPHVDGALVGPTLRAILSDQFQRLRDGDRFWYENYLAAPLVDLVEQQTLAVIIRRNTDVGDELQDDVFTVPAPQGGGPGGPRGPGGGPGGPGGRR